MPSRVAKKPTTGAPEKKKPSNGRTKGGAVNKGVADLRHKKHVRLHMRAIVASYRRNLRRQYMNTNILKVEGCKTPEDAKFYLGKRVAYVFRARPVHKGRQSLHGFRVLWGKVTRTHGNSGAIRARFPTPLPTTALGKYARVMLYPSHI